MPRLHFFEFGDQPWVPKFLRDYETDFLEFAANQMEIYKDIYPLLKKGIGKADNHQIIDLGSGGGGGWPTMSQKFIDQDVKFSLKLTDFNPNIGAFKKLEAAHPSVISYDPNPVDAGNVKASLKGFRTMFLSFHHLKPKKAQQVLQNAVDAEQPIGIFELQDRSLLSVLLMTITAPILAILTSVFIRPFKLGRILCTIVPILPLIIWFDGIVSNLRTYNESDLQTLVGRLDQGDTYEWEIGRKKKGARFIIYLLGYKK